VTVAPEREWPARLVGVATPRIGPPMPARSKFKDYEQTAKAIGITLRPWQKTAAKYMTAGTKDGWTFREVAIIVGRQNGKTELLVPRILMDLRAGRRIIHTAQNRTLPREVFMRVVWMLERGEAKRIREANGQEQITMVGGGSYRIVAPQRGARGLTADTLIFDELREFEDYDIIGAATPTLTASSDPQTLYLSNAGSHRSVVLNDLKRRGEAGNEPDLAYLEWSAQPERSIDDRVGWVEANPSVGHGMRLETIEHAYRTKPPQLFEVEHLCRWVDSMLPSVVSEAAWFECLTDIGEKPARPVIALNMSPTGSRASAVMAWQMTDGRIALVELLEATGAPIDTATLGPDIQALKMQHGAKRVAYASWTDKDLERHVRGAEALDGKEFAAASEFFARSVMQGRLAVDGLARGITADIKWSARKPHDSGSWIVTPADPERPITGVLAAVRAVWMASQPRSTPRIG
jgi:hypothetical protein